MYFIFFFFSSRRRHTRLQGDWSSDVCSSDLIPWASNYFTETLIERTRKEFGQSFWGFLMLGGMSGGGMGFIFAPEKKAQAQRRLQEIMADTKRELEHALPFAMEPVVYDFAINEQGTLSELLEGADALM